MPMSRKWKYDPEQTEYFVQTSDTVKLKKSELERWLHTQDGSEEAAFYFSESSPNVIFKFHLVVPSTQSTSVRECLATS